MLCTLEQINTGIYIYISKWLKLLKNGLFWKGLHGFSELYIRKEFFVGGTSVVETCQYTIGMLMGLGDRHGEEKNVAVLGASRYCWFPIFPTIYI